MLNTSEFSAAGNDLATALDRSTTNPADAVRLLLPLAGYMAPKLPGAGPLWAVAQGLQDAFASNLRTAACAALGRAVARYQPVSYQDAQSLRLLVCGALEAEAIRAADAGLDATYQALWTLRWAVALDLSIRGARLAVLVNVETQVSMPSLAETWTLYQDTSREPELVGSAAPAHPLFMPLEFAALAR